MVVRVKFKGLKIANARGKYYVYRRETGEPLIKGFIGSRAELLQKLEDPEFIQVYNRPRLLKRRAGDFPIETLGGFIHWYTCGAIDDAKESEVDGYPKWWKLAKSTRDDYLDAFDYLRPEFDIVLKDITQPALYEVRDTCANDKWPRFADQMIAALSSMFRQAVKRGKMSFNPCLGMDKAHKADPNANREWEPEEWQFARENAPLEIKICLFLARYAGLRGQTIVQVNRKQFKAHPLTLIAVRDDGTVWPSEKEMQTRVSHWLRDQERAGHIGAGTTLHGLRVSYAAWWRRNGANTREVADLIGDESERMGAHYTRHVEAEQNIIRAFSRIKDRQDKV